MGTEVKNMISIDSTILVYDLRVVRRLLREHNSTLEQSEWTAYAEDIVIAMIERIESNHADLFTK